jgi:hypothetical protein
MSVWFLNRESLGECFGARAGLVYAIFDFKLVLHLVAIAQFGEVRRNFIL